MNPFAQCILLAVMMGLITVGSVTSVTESKCRLDDIKVRPGSSADLYNIHLKFSVPAFPNIKSTNEIIRHNVSKAGVAEYGEHIKTDEMWRCFVHTGFPISVISLPTDTWSIQYLAPFENSVNLRVAFIVCAIYTIALIFILQSAEAASMENNNKLNKKTNID